MELIKEICSGNFTAAVEKKVVRRAARAILFNDSCQIAFLHVTKDGYHKLPGGGVEAGEALTEALERELLEEVGVEARVVGEVGIIIERREGFEQTSYCYVAEMQGECRGTSFTEEEIRDGFALGWVTLAEAIALLEADEPLSRIGISIRERDLSFLRYYQEHLA